MNKRLLATIITSVMLTACAGESSEPAPAVNASNNLLSDDGSADSANANAGNTNDDGAGVNNDTEEVAVEPVAPVAVSEGPDAGEVQSSDENTTIAEPPAETGNVDNVSDNSPADPVAEPVNVPGPTEPDDVVDIQPPAGLLDTAMPTFLWPAIENAEEYKIVVKDADGSGYAKSIDPLTANCQTGEGVCSADTGFGYFDNDLSWYVESTVDGSAGPTSETFNVTTPVSENMMPIKSNTLENCEAWAAVSYDKYVVLNNSWNSRSVNDPDWSQRINVTESANGTVVPAWSYDWRGQFDGDEIAVKAYPEVLYGPKLGTHVSGTKEETGLPERVRDLPEFVVNYEYSETGNAERNVALESFFHDSDDIRGPCDDDDNRVYEMMIWVANPSIRTPGDLALTGVMIDNQLWNVYIKPRSNKHYIAFTAQNETTSGTLNWKRFVDWTAEWTAANAEALEIDVLDPDFHMGAIEIGTEMWWGEGTFTLNKFDVSF